MAEGRSSEHPLPTTSPSAFCFFRPDETGTGRYLSGVRSQTSVSLLSWGEAQPEPDVVVPVVRGVVVAVRRPAITGVVVPAAPAKHPVRAFQDRTPIFLYHIPAKIGMKKIVL